MPERNPDGHALFTMRMRHTRARARLVRAVLAVLLTATSVSCGGGAPAPSPDPLPGAPDGEPSSPEPAHGSSVWLETYEGEAAISVFADAAGRLFLTSAVGDPSVGDVTLRFRQFDTDGVVQSARDIARCAWGTFAGVSPTTGDVVLLADAWCVPTVWTAGYAPPGNGGLVELTPAGDFVRWIAPDTVTGRSAEAAVAPDGSILVVLDALLKLSADGSELWRRPLDIIPVMPPVPLADGGAIVWTFGEPQQLVRISGSGDTVWSVPQKSVHLRPNSKSTWMIGRPDGMTLTVERNADATIALSVLDGEGHARARSDAGDAASTLIAALPGGGWAFEYERIASGRVCAFLRLYSEGLEQQWERPIDPQCNATITAMTATADRIYVVGWFTGEADLGIGDPVVSTARRDSFLVSIAR